MGASFSTGDDDAPIVDINVTPMVDIMLVLLIIFMVTATFILNPSIKINLPKAASKDEAPATKLIISIDKSGGLFLNDKKTDIDGIKKFIAANHRANPDLKALISGDRDVSYGTVIHVLDEVKLAGITKYAVQVDRGK